MLKMNHCKIQLLNCRSVLLLIFIPCLIHAQQLSNPDVQVKPYVQSLESSIEVPVQIPLQPWFEKIEQLTPLQTGHWRSWKRKHGLEAKYRAWRGPLLVQADGDSILMQAHVRYWLKGRTDLPGPFDISASCGVNEASRQAIIGVRVRFDWQSDWSLQPRTQVLPTRFLDRCQVTSLNLDVTPIIGELFNRELKKSIHNSLGQLDNDLKEIRHQASRLWERVNHPIALTNHLWLKLQPAEIAVSPFSGSGDQVFTHIKVSLQPQLLPGNRPESEFRPLPMLGQFYPGDNRLNVHFSLPLDYPQISHALSQRLAQREFNIQGHQFSISGVQLTASDSRLNAVLNLLGAAAGKLTISGKLSATESIDGLTLNALDYSFEPEDFQLKILADLFQNKIRQELEKAANTLLSQQTHEFKSRLQDYFQSALPELVKIQFNDLHLTATDINLQADGLMFSGMINGKLRLDLKQKTDAM